MKRRLAALAAAASILLTSVGVSARGTGAIRWYNCIDEAECREIGTRLREDALEKKDIEKYLAAMLSLLVAEHLKGEGRPLDLAVVNEVVSAASRYSGRQEAEEIKTLLDLIFKGSSPLLKKILLGHGFVPFAAFFEAKALLEEGRCVDALPYFDKLFRRYEKRADVLYYWARSHFDCGIFSGRIYKKLASAHAREPHDLGIVSQMIRYLKKRGDREGALRLLAGVGVGSAEISRSDALVAKDIYRLMAGVCFVRERDLPKALAYMRLGEK